MLIGSAGVPNVTLQAVYRNQQKTKKIWIYKKEIFIMKKVIASVLSAALALSLVACGGSSAPASSAAPAAPAASSEAAEPIVVKVAASATPHAEILEGAVAAILAEQGITLDVDVFDDYVQPNNVVEEGEYFANYFQHTPYLDSFNADNGTHLVSAVSVHYEPYAVYAGKTKAIADLANGAQIAVPNDPSNEARALQLLAAAGIIELDPNAGLSATKLDITANPLNVEIVEMEAAQLPRTLADVDLAVINGNYAKEADLTPAKDGLFVEASDSDFAQTYANILCVREDNLDSDVTKALVEAITSEAVRDFITSTYADGSVLAIF